MDSTGAKIVNEIIRSKNWIRLTEEVSVQSDSVLRKGKIEVDTQKSTLLFDVIVSGDFPLGSISFICTNEKGYQHEMHNGLICLNAAPAKALVDRVELELEKLELWIDHYYVKEIPDKHFEYYQFYQNGPFPMVFEEDEEKTPIKKAVGKFSYSILNERIVKEKEQKSYIALDLGGRKCRWSKSFLNQMGETFSGIWIYIKKPPVIQRRQTIEEWKDLLGLMTNEQTAFIHDHLGEIKKNSAFPGGFFIMIGYDISTETGFEVHWDSILVAYSEFPFSVEKVKSGEYKAVDKGRKVLWGMSSNASYKRMFGRGRLPDALVNSKILIAGTGAIGSSLFMALVRGGAKYVDIQDGESIDSGNICRGQFAFRSSYFQKVTELQFEAIATSPYIEVNASGKIDSMNRGNIAYTAIKNHYMQYDYIFDCTTDKYLSITIDEMQLKGTVINLSISDEAKQFVLVTGNGNIHLVKNSIYSKFTAIAEPFYVATGCWHPTFRASYSDINALLHYAINEISGRISKNMTIQSFVIEKEYDETGKLKYNLNYNV